MGQADEFVQSMTAVDRQLRMGTRTAPSEATYLQFVRQQVIPWKEEEAERITAAARLLGERLASPGSAFPPSLWPNEILLVQTTGREEGGAAYCRGKKVVVLPHRLIDQPPDNLARLLCHELFHILSRQSSDRQERLYAILGFQRVDTVPLPVDLATRKLTNPDAPQINCIVNLLQGETEQTYCPVLLARKEAYDSPPTNGLFGELEFRLMRVRQSEEGWRAASHPRPDSASDLFAPEQLPDYKRRIGRNTGYVIHPEEVLADNFVHFVFKTSELPDAWIVQKLADVLANFHSL